MIRKHAIGIAAVLFVALVAPGHATGNDASGERAGALLEKVMEHFQNGELDPAWEAYAAFFDDPGNKSVSVKAFGRCFYEQECPALGLLAFVLGKSEADAGDYRSFCPDWNGNAPLVESPDGLSKDERLMWGFRNGAMGGSCAKWVAENAAWFVPRPSAHRRKPQVLPLVSIFPDDHRPHAKVHILGTRTISLLDTGATMPNVNRQLAQQEVEKVEFIQIVQVNNIRARRPEVLARVNRIQIGEATFPRPVVTINDMYWVDSGEPVPAELKNSVGMNLLLQYDKVCFDWEGSKLYLGELGPCEGGATPYRHWLTGQLGIAVHAKISQTDYVRTGIDTGSPITYCSKWFTEQNVEREAISFGSNEALIGECTYDPEIWFNNQEHGADSSSKHILLGMDTLSNFAAFGWHLDPLRVYFVPKSLDSLQSESRNSEQETSDRQDDSPNQQ